MTSIATRNSVLAVVAEVTEGTPVAPTLATDYVALQSDLELSPQTDTLSNEELRASIGRAKPILGAENPTVSFSHYLRASGVQGQAPNYRQLLKSFFGTETVNVTERLTGVGSTVTQLVLAAGGADFPLGAGMLIKDTTNGYRVRVSTGNSGLNVPLSFAVPVAPAAGIGVGICVYYSPANTGHQSLTIWHFLGQGGATQMTSGNRVVDFSYSATAGELINASYSTEALAYFFDPITILSTDRFIDFTDDDGTWAAEVPVRVYKSPIELASTLQAAMRAANPGETPTVTYSNTTGKFTITTTGVLFSILWNTGGNAANTIGDKIGFLTAADDTGAAPATGYTSDNAQSYASPQTPTYDTSDPLAAKFHEVMIGEQTDYACFEASSIEWSSNNSRRAIESLCAESGRSGSVITAREGSISVTALLSQYDAQQYERYRIGDEIRFQYTFGTKTGGNWNPGLTGYSFCPLVTITEFSVTDDDGLATLNMTLQPAVGASGQGEMFLGFL